MSVLTDKISEMVVKLRREYPRETANMTDLDIISHVVPTSKIQKAAPLGTEALTEEERRRRMGAKNKPGEAARHPTASPVSSASDSPVKKATASGPLTRGGVQVLWDHGVAEIMKRGGMGKYAATETFLKTDEGMKLFAALDDPSIPAGPAPMPYEPSVQSESVRKHRERAAQSTH